MEWSETRWELGKERGVRINYALENGCGGAQTAGQVLLILNGET